MASAARVSAGGSLSTGMPAAAVSTTAMTATAAASGLESKSGGSSNEDSQKQLNKVPQFEKCRHRITRISMCTLP